MAVLVLNHHFSPRNPWFASQIEQNDGFLQRDGSVPYRPTPILSPPPPSEPSNSTRISPAVLFIIVILAVIFFISGLLHLLVRFLLKKHQSQTSLSNANGAAGQATAGPEALQRQLQQLFHLHDAGLDQAFIDALPVFLYREVVGAKEPFDCAVCLCEFADDDKLRLLPLCGHAFHIDCIDTWLLSNSTCPLCRGALFVPGLAVDNPMLEFDSAIDEEWNLPGNQEDKPEGGEEMAAMDKRLFPVRLGKFKNLGRKDNTNGNGAVLECDNGNGNGNDGGVVRREEGETSSSSLDARRCYSMGSYQYVLGDANLQVALSSVTRRNGDGRGLRMRGVGRNSTNNEVFDGKMICAGSKGDSFSVSKIWQWRNNKGKLPVLSPDSSSGDGGLPWARRSVGDT